MYPIPARALSLLGRSHGAEGRLLASINGSDFVVPLELQSGTGEVQVDSKSPARRTLTATVRAEMGDPRVNPLAAEVRAEQAIIDPTSGEAFWVPVGTFVVTGAKETSRGLTTITATDRWQRVLEARFERSVTTSGDTVAAIRSLLQGADSRITLNSSAAPVGYTHRASLWERDRDKAIMTLAKSIGCVVYFDPLGVARLEPIKPLGGSPVWQISPGLGGVKIGSAREISRGNTYNAVAVTGEPGNGLAAVYGIARDTDTFSPTRWGGPFGMRTRFYESNQISTQAQAQAVAQSYLDRVRGVAQSVTVQAVQHPGLDADDVIMVHLNNGEYRPHRVVSFPLSLGLGTTTIAAAAGLAEEDDGGS